MHQPDEFTADFLNKELHYSFSATVLANLVKSGEVERVGKSVHVGHGRYSHKYRIADIELLKRSHKGKSAYLSKKDMLEGWIKIWPDLAVIKHSINKSCYTKHIMPFTE